MATKSAAGNKLANHGAPHHRVRLYVVGMHKSAQCARRPFQWPRPVPLKHGSPLQRLTSDKPGWLPSHHLQNGRCRRLAKRSFRLCKLKGIDPLRTSAFVDIDCSDKFFRHSIDGSLPCLTSRRATSGGDWVSTRGRRTTMAELFRCQALSESRCDWAARVFLPPT